MSKRNYEVGGRVQISGKWYEIRKFRMVQVDACREMELEKLEEFIQAYDPPKKNVIHEWLDADQLDSIEGGRFTITNEDVNRKLTELHGAPPIARTYKGEEAGEFGLKNDDSVLFWCEHYRFWEAGEFGCLEEGEKWILQPPAPKEED